jgi:hypothetical protein
VIADTPAAPETSRILLNFPPELAEQVRVLAKRERRTLTAQVQVMVEHALRMMQAAA